MENEALVQRDYNFLTQLDRTLAVKRQDSRQNKVMKRQRVNNGDGQGVKRGVNVKYLPKGMQRSNQNKSGWDKKRETFVWSVEFQLMNGNGELLETFHSLRVPEETPLKDAIHLKIKERMGDVPLWCFLRKVDCSASRPVVKKLDMDKVLADELRGETVIEFPTIIVCDEQIIEGYKEGDENSSASDSDGESDSSSDSESSDSDSDSDSEGGSSDDDRPEEESSKRKMTNDSTTGPFEVLKVELNKDEAVKENTIETNDDAEHIKDIVQPTDILN